MLEELLKKCFDEEMSADKSVENIKTVVLSRIEEEKPMKHFTIKPLLIAAAITATGAVTLATANAATDGAVVDKMVRTFTLILNGEEVEGTITEYSVGDDGEAKRVEVELPEGAVGDNMAIFIDEDGEAGIIAGDDINYAQVLGEDVDIMSFDKAYDLI